MLVQYNYLHSEATGMVDFEPGRARSAARATPRTTSAGSRRRSVFRADADCL